MPQNIDQNQAMNEVAAKAAGVPVTNEEQQKVDYAAYRKTLEMVVFNPSQYQIVDPQATRTDSTENNVFRATVLNVLGIYNLRDQVEMRRISPPGSNWQYLPITIRGQQGVIGAVRIDYPNSRLEFLDRDARPVPLAVLREQIVNTVNRIQREAKEGAAKQAEQKDIGQLTNLINEIDAARARQR